MMEVNAQPNIMTTLSKYLAHILASFHHVNDLDPFIGTCAAVFQLVVSMINSVFLCFYHGGVVLCTQEQKTTVVLMKWGDQFISDSFICFI